MVETRSFLKLEKALRSRITPAYASHWAEVHRLAREGEPRAPQHAPAPDPDPFRSRELILLDAAEALVRPGDALGPTALQQATELPMTAVRQLIASLRRQGRWPYARPPRNGRASGLRRPAHRAAATN